MDFSSEFQKLAKFKPLSWQSRLFAEHFASGMLPAAIDVPTGLGKTSVMTIWYLALKAGSSLPRRLVYVVDRRAVVDQATNVADKIKEKSKDDRLRVSTLRGQHLDKGEWLADPAAPAIIVGTVDMIGSRLLFSGYGVSSKMRPYHAGLLGADTLVVLDESHLVPPFEKLLGAIDGGSATFAPHAEADQGIVPPFKLLSLSATGRPHKGLVFRLDEKKGDLADEVVRNRLGAKKSLIKKSTNGEKLEVVLADQAWMLSGQGKNPVRVLVYCNSREIAEKTKEAIKQKAKADRKKNILPTEISEPELFVGARRVVERIDAEKRLRDLGFLAGSGVKLEIPSFVVATSAGEVGVDMDADHMVCDLVPWERMVQRLGRVNRLGMGDAQVVLVHEDEPQPKKPNEPNQEEVRAMIAWRSFLLLGALPRENGIDVSPGALRTLKLRAEIDSALANNIAAATTPPPLHPALSRALVDAWSMTSLEEHTGRPEVAPWLRGWVDDEPQTAVVWRTFLPVRTRGGTASRREIEGFFEAAPPHLSEKLETETWRVANWLLVRAEVWEKRIGEVNATPIAFALSSDGKLRKCYDLEKLLKYGDNRNRKELLIDLAGTTLVVDARVGGLKNGLLNDDADGTEITTADGEAGWEADGIDLGFRIFPPSTEPESDGTVRITYAFSTELSEEGEELKRLLIATRKTEESRAQSRHPQLLDEHQSWTEQKARWVAAEIGLNEDYTETLAIAARLHDEGKRAARWQRAFNAPWENIYAKTRGPLNLGRLGGYRHELGSLPYAERDEKLKRLPADLQDLVLHLIAAHHGRARPTIETLGCDDAPPSLLENRARDVALRFVRLQKKWGPWGLAWWEALLRAADQQSSRENDQRKGGTNGGS